MNLHELTTSDYDYDVMGVSLPDHASESGIAPEYLNEGFKELFALVTLPTDELIARQDELLPFVKIDPENQYPNAIRPPEYAHTDYDQNWVRENTDTHTNHLNRIIRNLQHYTSILCHTCMLITENSSEQKLEKRLKKYQKMIERAILSAVNLIAGYHDNPSGASKDFYEDNFHWKIMEALKQYKKSPDDYYEEGLRNHEIKDYDPDDYDLKSRDIGVEIANTIAEKARNALKDPKKLLENEGEGVDELIHLIKMARRSADSLRVPRHER